MMHGQKKISNYGEYGDELHYTIQVGLIYSKCIRTYAEGIFIFFI